MSDTCVRNSLLSSAAACARHLQTSAVSAYQRTVFINGCHIYTQFTAA